MGTRGCERPLSAVSVMTVLGGGALAECVLLIRPRLRCEPSGSRSSVTVDCVDALLVSGLASRPCSHRLTWPSSGATVERLLTSGLFFRPLPRWATLLRAQVLSAAPGFRNGDPGAGVVMRSSVLPPVSPCQSRGHTRVHRCASCVHVHICISVLSAHVKNHALCLVSNPVGFSVFVIPSSNSLDVFSRCLLPCVTQRLVSAVCPSPHGCLLLPARSPALPGNTVFPSPVWPPSPRRDGQLPGSPHPGGLPALPSPSQWPQAGSCRHLPVSGVTIVAAGTESWGPALEMRERPVLLGIRSRTASADGWEDLAGGQGGGERSPARGER